LKWQPLESGSAVGAYAPGPMPSLALITTACALAPLIIGHRPSNDLTPQYLSVAGLSHGAFQALDRSSILKASSVLHIATPDHPNVMPIHAKSANNASSNAERSHLDVVSSSSQEHRVHSEHSHAGAKQLQAASKAEPKKARCTWTKPVFGALAGHNLEIYDGETMETCKLRCDWNPACKSIDFNPGNAQCNLGDCQIEDGRCKHLINAAWQYSSCQALPGGLTVGDRVVSQIDFDRANGEKLRKGDVCTVRGGLDGERVVVDCPQMASVYVPPRVVVKVSAALELAKKTVLLHAAHAISQRDADWEKEQITEVKKAIEEAKSAGEDEAQLADAYYIIQMLEEAHKEATDVEKSDSAQNSLKHVTKMSKQTIVSVVVALLLLGFVMFDFCVLYMVNYPDEQVRSYSYKLVSQTISVLCAVLVETAQLDFFIKGLLFKGIAKLHKLNGNHDQKHVLDDVNDHDDEHYWPEFFTCLGMFMVWFIAISIMSRHFRSSVENLFMVNAVVAHEAAFVCIHTFGHMEEHVAHQSDKAEDAIFAKRWIYRLYPLCLLMVLRILTQFSHWIRMGSSPSSGQTGAAPPVEHDAASKPSLPPIAEGIEEMHEDVAVAPATSSRQLGHGESFNIADMHPSQEETSESKGHGGLESTRSLRCSLDESRSSHADWRENVMEAEDEMCAIVIAYLLRQSTLYFACGRIPTLEGDFKDHSPEMFESLGMAICTYIMMLTVTTWYISQHHGDAHSAVMHNKDGRRFVQFLQVLWAMTIAWHCLSMGRWLLQMFVDQPALQFVANAFCLSPVCVVIVILVDKLADNQAIYENTAEIIIESVGLLVGFAWEKAFYHAVHTVIDFNEITFSQMISTEWMECVLCLGLVAFMLPAWKFIIVPQSCQPVPVRDWHAHDPKAATFVSKRSSLIGSTIGQQLAILSSAVLQLPHPRSPLLAV
jgi:hypothetical protein